MSPAPQPVFLITKPQFARFSGDRHVALSMQNFHEPACFYGALRQAVAKAGCGLSPLCHCGRHCFGGRPNMADITSSMSTKAQSFHFIDPRIRIASGCPRDIPSVPRPGASKAGVAVRIPEKVSDSRLQVSRPCFLMCPWRL